MDSRPSHVTRACSLLLLVLMVSPITAPFSTCDLRDLLGGAGASGAAVLQSKTATNDHVTAACTPVRPGALQPAAALDADADHHRVCWHPVIETPLRI